jgi:hypothetical protein
MHNKTLLTTIVQRKKKSSLTQSSFIQPFLFVVEFNNKYHAKYGEFAEKKNTHIYSRLRAEKSQGKKHIKRVAATFNSGKAKHLFDHVVG